MYVLGTSLAGLLGFTITNEVAKRKVMSSVTTNPPYKVSGPLISAIIPAYNESGYIELLLSSLRNQTYDNIEIIVVDDESEDDTVEIVESYDAKVVHKDDKVCCNSKSRNMGASCASGNYLVFIDADTVLEHSLIEKTVELLKSGKELVYSNHCSTDDTIQGTLRVFLGYVDPVSIDTPSYLTDLVSINGQYVACTRDAYDTIGGYDESLKPEGNFGEDRVFALSIARTFGIDSAGFLRHVFSGTSARRAKKMGYLNDILNRSSRYLGFGHTPMDREHRIR